MLGSTNGRRRLVIVLTGVLVFVHLWLSGPIAAPSVVFDEAGYLGTARWLTGDRGWPMPPSPTYASGYPLLISPIVALFDDPARELRAVLAVNAVLLASLFPLLLVFLRKVLGVRWTSALLAALTGAITAPVLAAGISVIAENLVLPLVVATSIGAWAMAAPGRPSWQRLTYGPLVATLHAAHPRFTLPLVVAVGLLCWAAVSGRLPRRVAAANVGLLLGIVVVGRWVHRAVVTSRWQEVEDLQGGWNEWLELATSRRGLLELADTATGQVWYLVAGSLGLTAIGLVVAIGLLRQPGTSAGDGPTGGDEATARRLALLHLLTAAAAVFTTSVVFFAQNQFRIDHYVYGRHNDSFTPLFVALAVAGLTGPALGDRRRALWAVAAAGIVLVVSTLVVDARRSPHDFGGGYSAFATPAISRTVERHPDRAFSAPALPAAASLTLIALAVAVTHRGRGRRPSLRHEHPTTTRVRSPLAPPLVLAVVLLPGAWFVLSGNSVSATTAGFAEMDTGGWHGPDDLRRLGISEVAIDHSVAGTRPTLNYPFALPGTRFTTFDGNDASHDQTSEVVLTGSDDERLSEEGARIALLDTSFVHHVLGADRGLAVWVRPGTLQERLEQRGALLPRGFPTALPPEARPAELSLLDPPHGPVRIRSGGRASVTVAVRHAGTGAPWPDHASFDLSGGVRVVALVEPDGPNASNRVKGARSGGELPRWTVPGDRVIVQVDLVAVDRSLAPLPPGRYRVELAVAQSDPSGGEDLWETRGGPAASLLLEVTP